jgi:glyoxylase I family protein
MPLQFAFEHLAVASRNPEELKDWYVKVLGAKVVAQLNPDPPAYMVEISKGILVEIYKVLSNSDELIPNSAQGWRHVALQVDSLEVARTMLEQLGVKPEDPVKPAGGGGKVLFFRDLEGNLFHLVERPSGSPFQR